MYLAVPQFSCCRTPTRALCDHHDAALGCFTTARGARFGSLGNANISVLSTPTVLPLYHYLIHLFPQHSLLSFLTSVALYRTATTSGSWSGQLQLLEWASDVYGKHSFRTTPTHRTHDALQHIVTLSPGYRVVLLVTASASYYLALVEKHLDTHHSRSYTSTDEQDGLHALGKDCQE